MFKRILSYIKSKIENLCHVNSKDMVLYTNLIQEISAPIKDRINCIIFSMNRALQLDALLRSFDLNKIGECPIYVLYKATDEMHSKAYHELISLHRNKAVFIEENNLGFKTQLLNIVNGIDTGKLFFLVDDIFFTEPVDFNLLSQIDTSRYIFSLRMGNHLSYSYVVDKSQKLPTFFETDENFLYWHWNEGELDWAYPLSVDGHIFNTNEIKLLIENCDFKAPNSFEASLQHYKHLFTPRIGMCYHKARIVNNPCNKVQNEINNIHGTYHQDDLLRHWRNKQEIDIEKLQGYVNQSVHEEIEFSFKDRVR